MSRVLVAGLLCCGLLLAGCRADPTDPDNELPAGFLDTPAAGSVLRPGPTLVGGWAVDDHGIAEVRVFFDGHFKAATTLAVARPDVSKAVPQYARGGDLHGWNVAVDFGLSPGQHTVLAQAVDTHGATKDIGVAVVTIPR